MTNVIILSSLQVLQSDHVEGYRLRVERLPNVCNINEYTYGLNTTEFELSLSMATYKISINAFNKAGNSPSVSSLVPYSSSQDFPGKIHATVQNNSIVLTWNPIRNCPFFIINWGTNTTQMKTDSSVVGNIGTYSLPGPFEAMKQYSIIIYEYETCECTKNISMETTYGITYIYAEEGVPKTAPANITISNVTKHSAVLQWKEIPEMDCMGFLLGYKIYFTDRRRNITQDVIINSSTITSYLLKEITEGNTYEVKISGYTSKGEGVPSVSYTFTTPNYAQYEFETIVISTCIGIVFVVILAVTLCVYIFHRAREYYFPKIPNPKYSNIVKIHEEMTGKNELMPTLLLVSKEDFSGDTSHLEVTEEVQSVYVPLAESSEVSEDDISLIKKSNTTNVVDPCGNQESKVQNAMVIIDYSNMNFMQNMMKNMLQPSSHGEQRNNDVQCNPPCTMALHDYIKDNVILNK
ncbi:leukemia inhibitory factor receptor [Bombina bombina]|uniref:leukemia inhibitory factor receptor n=1 Tax=Bombina bombina TaxID=8345 RepID=UPI00235A8BDD|nr:leukemia inhibitory factor receptor [Bombina bombina]